MESFIVQFKICFAMGNQIHVVRNGNVWKLKQDGCTRSSGVFDHQYQAIERGRQIAMNQRKELTIHAVDGHIREKRSYGNDPFPPKG